MDYTDNFHEITSTGNTAPNDIRHVKPLDYTRRHVWLFEPQTRNGASLTQDGVTQIAFHEYKAGSYTFLDNLLNPAWAALTECLPMSMAPNLVTTLGALHCFAAYLVTWQYSANLNETVPAWVLLFSAYCMAAYYTLDCCDGKQARRTQSSSPLGQLFDHGVDCVCNLSHLSMVHAWLQSGGSIWFFLSQGTLQFCFFLAQWEEYFTGTLPHATGDFGVTEVNYGIAIMTAANAFLDRSIYQTPLSELLPAGALELFDQPWAQQIVESLPEAARTALQGTIELRHALLASFTIAMTVLVTLSISRVFSSLSTTKERLSAVSKLLTPVLLSLSPFGLPTDVIARETRQVSIAVGLVLCLVTIKIIVFSMAKQSYAVVQWDALPLLAAVAWVRSDPRLTDKGIHAVFLLLSVFYLARLYIWTSSAIRQICQRLDINLFTIKAKAKKE